MTRLFFGIFLVSFGVLMACGGETQETTQTTIPIDSAGSELAAPATFLSRFSSRLQQIVHSEEGVVRGFVPGESIDSISSEETANPDYDSTRSKRYTIGDPLTNADNFDITYFFQPQSRRTDSLVVDTYLSSLTASDSLMTELGSYFTTRFGQPVTRKPKLVVWEADGNQILVKDVGIKLAPGLQIVVRRKQS